MTQLQLKDGDCPSCDGCGYVANDDDGTPWRAWLKLPLESSAAVIMGLVKPVECQACGGTGDKYVVTSFSIVKESKDAPRHRTFEVLPDDAKAKGRWWVSWWGQSGFNLRLPWWVSGERDGEDNQGRVSSFCAAVLANSEDEARAVIANTTGTEIDEWRFVEPRPVDWSPFCDRFPLGDWMQWPKEKER